MEADHISKKKIRIKKERGFKKKPRKQKEEQKTRMHAP
jgi:hypothetical protein